MDLNKFSEDTMRTCQLALQSINKILECNFKNFDRLKVESIKDVLNLANGLSGLSRSIADVERSTRERKALLLECKEIIASEFQRLLEVEPELVEGVHRVLDMSCENLIKREQIDSIENKRTKKLINNKRNV